MNDEFKVVTWQQAAKYTKRRVFIERASSGDLLEVRSISRRGPNLRVVLLTGRVFEVARSRRFLSCSGKKEGRG